MPPSWSFHPRTAIFWFTSCCVVLILVSLSFIGADETISLALQFILFAVFCLALGVAGFSLVREQSKIFGLTSLLVGAFAFIIPWVMFLWFPGVLRH